MRIKDMKTGDVVAVGRGMSNRLAVVVRSEVWTESRGWGSRASTFSKGKGNAYQATSGILAIETEITCGTQGYYYDIDPEDKRVVTAIKRATKEANRLAALSDEELIAHLSEGDGASRGKFGCVCAISPGNITDTLDGQIEAVAARKESDKRKEALRIQKAAELDGYTVSIEKSLAKLGGGDLSFSASLEGTKFSSTKALAALLEELAAR